MIAAAVIAVVAAPLVRGDTGGAGSLLVERLEELEARKEAKYREIRDAQGDLRAGKLSEVDHRALDAGLRRDAVAILAEIDRVSDSPAEGTGPTI